MTYGEHNALRTLAAPYPQDYHISMATTLVPVKNYPFLLNGKLVSDGKAVEVRAPYDGVIVGSVTYGTRQHAEQAIAAAERAFGTTKRLPAYERQRVLRAIAAALIERKEE